MPLKLFADVSISHGAGEGHQSWGGEGGAVSVAGSAAGQHGVRPVAVGHRVPGEHVRPLVVVSSRGTRPVILAQRTCCLNI